jgi:hypothetical protein
VKLAIDQESVEGAATYADLLMKGALLPRDLIPAGCQLTSAKLL